jgi:hypothetical protein
MIRAMLIHMAQGGAVVGVEKAYLCLNAMLLLLRSGFQLSKDNI